MSDDFKVIEGKFGKQEAEPEMVKASEVLDAAADVARIAEEDGVQTAEVTVIYQMKGVPSLIYSNTDQIRLPYLLDLAKQDVLTCIWAEETAEAIAEEMEDDDDPTVH